MPVKPSITRVFIVIGLGVAFIGAALILRGPILSSIDRLENAAIAVKANGDVATAFGKHRLNVLVLGNQADEGTSDTMILAHLDLDRHLATLVSIPRDTWVDVPRYGWMKINSAIGAGGPQLSATVVSALLGAPIDAIMVVRPEGAKQLVDAMGGLNVNVEHDMNYDDNWGNLHIHLKKGEQYLTGGQVLDYMRYRGDADGDFGRMRRQQQVVREIAREMSRPSQWSKLPHLVQLARQDVITKLSDKQLEALIEVYRSVDADDVRALTLPSRVGSVGDASVVFVDERWAKLIGKLLFSRDAPPQDDMLVANASGDVSLDKTLVGALRGGGWNVQTFVDQKAVAESEIVGSTPTADELSRALPPIKRHDGRSTVLRIGADLLPNPG